MARSIDETHDPERRSWVESAFGHPDFPIQNLPLGVFDAGDGPRCGIAIGEEILDLHQLADTGLLDGEIREAVTAPTLNALLGRGPAVRQRLRRQISTLLSDRAHEAQAAALLRRAQDCAMQLPCTIGDYTDFYAGIHHATNVGRLFRPDAPLLPNYKYVPIGYHGRASSVSVSGAALARPSGQRKPPDAPEPSFGPSQRLDYELELGVWIGAGNALGMPVPIAQAEAHIAGLCLLNDWSARDLQAWEYQPLGPFLAKSFLTTISPWIVTLEALEPFRLAQPPRPDSDPAPLPYLSDAADQAGGAFALTLEVFLTTGAMRRSGAAPHRLSLGAATDLYWTIAQLVTHHTSNGCNLRPGDLLGTGTISGRTPSAYGSLLELTVGGREPIVLPSGERRGFLEDGDEITLRATARADGFVPIGFGACSGAVKEAA